MAKGTKLRAEGAPFGEDGAAPQELAGKVAGAELDEQRLARTLNVAIPIVTVLASTGIGFTIGAPQAILALAAGVMIGVIALLWASIRVLSGDAPLPPEIEALDRSGHPVDALTIRKQMLLRALKDLQAEHEIGKLGDEDYEDVARTYRAELKDVLKRIDESLAPFRDQAEREANAFLLKSGLAHIQGLEDDLEAVPEGATRDAVREALTGAVADHLTGKSARITCTSCGISNEPDATFCKKCGTGLKKASAPSDEDDDESDDEADAKEQA